MNDLANGKSWDIHDTIFSFDEAGKVAKCDAHKVASDTTSYVSKNQITYFVILNVHGLIIKSYDLDSCYAFRADVLRYGYISVLRDFSSLSDAIINNNSVLPDTAVSGVLRNIEDPHKMLQVANFGKRFSPLGADKVEDTSIRAFFDNQRRIGDLYTIMEQCSAPCGTKTWVKRIRNSVAMPVGDVLLGDLKAELEPFFQSIRDLIPKMDNIPFRITSGSAVDAKRVLPSKMRCLSDTTQSLLGPSIPLIGKSKELLPSRLVDLGTQTLFERVVHWYEGSTFSLLKAVPKTYKAARIIAEEHVSQQVYASRHADLIEQAIHNCGWDKYIHLRDQSFNRHRAQEGSVTKKLATIDLSSASDSIARSLWVELVPADLQWFFFSFVPKYVLLDNQLHRTACYATSGNPLTFIVECVIFTAIDLLGGRYAGLFGSFEPIDPSVVGDDQIVDCRCYETICDLLCMLGFIVNTDKSFSGESPFRESCGGEFYDGFTIDSSLWPRKSFNFLGKGLGTCVTSLVSLQHALYEYVEARYFINDVVHRLETRMTYSPVGSLTGDLWGVRSQAKVALTPVKHDAKAGLTSRAAIATIEQSLVEAGLDEKTAHDTVTRERHLVPVLQEDRDRQLNEFDSFRTSRNVDAWNYYQFLAHGPYYDTPLDELLGVSSPRPSIVAYDPKDLTTVWVLKTI